MRPPLLGCCSCCRGCPEVEVGGSRVRCCTLHMHAAYKRRAEDCFRICRTGGRAMAVLRQHTILLLKYL